MTVKFKASTGRECDLTVTHMSGNRISIDVGWDGKPSKAEIAECDAAVPEIMRRAAATTVRVESSVYEEDDAKRMAIGAAFVSSAMESN